MKRIARVVLVGAMLIGAMLVAAPFTAAGAFELPGLDADANTYQQAIMAKSPAQPNPGQRDQALARAKAAVQAGNADGGIVAYEQALANGDDRTATWLALGELWVAAAKPDFKRALAADWLGYEAGNTPGERAAGLFAIGIVLEDHLDRQGQALEAYRAAAQEGDVPQLGARLAALTQKIGLTVKRVTVDADAEPPRACVEFTSELSPRRGVRFADYVKLEPSFDMAVEASGDSLCVAGFDFAKSYELTLLEGLPGADNLTLHKTDTETITVGNRQPSVAMRSSAFILPVGGGDGVPVTTVNVGSVALKVYRINDRNLVHQINDRQLLANLERYQAETIKEQDGQLIWQGTMAVDTKPNRQIVTAFPVNRAIGTTKPGIYIVAAEAVLNDDGARRRYDIPRATQWLVETDLALTVLRGSDGLHAFVRSYETAKPVPGIALSLVARNNGELGKATTGDDGGAAFAPGLVRGEGGDAPAAIMAYGPAGDYAMLDLTAAAFDLSDRGVGGRPAPGPLDAYLYTDRGVYRPGETVEVAGLLRDDHVNAAENLPLTLKVRRPNGSIFFDAIVKPQEAGFYHRPLVLSDTAPLGAWTVEAYADPKGQPIGQLDFAVDDFVPERLKVELAAASPVLIPKTPLTIAVDSQFLYGAPGADLGGTADMTIEVDPNPYPQLSGYHFGLVQDKLTPRLVQLSLPTSDARGHAELPIDLAEAPDTSLDLHAVIRVAVSEPGGRPTREALTLPVQTHPFAIGIKPNFDGNQMPERSDGGFAIVAVDRAGQRVAAPHLHYEIVRERTSYSWYLHEGTARFRVTVRDEKVKDGDIAATSAAAAEVTQRFEFGRYRIEVSDAASGAATSYRFWAGWELGPVAGDTPDKAEVTSDKPAYADGETAHIHVKPPYAGELLLTVMATDRVAMTRTLAIPAEGATLDLPVSRDWGPGAYVTATVFRPLVKGDTRAPLRAIGLTWLTLDPAPKTLAVAVTVPDHVKPRQTVRVPIKVSGTAPVNAAWITVAAVDEGILQLTEFTSPDPGGRFFAKRQLAVDIRDDYGRLIDAGGTPGQLRQGGDAGASGRGLPVVPTKTVALFAGPLKLDGKGEAELPLDLPDFNGQLRLMVVAFDRDRVGHGEAALIVRDDVVALATLPRFLAPGDTSQMTLSLHNLGGAPGTYTMALTASGAVGVDKPTTTIDLAAQARQTLAVGLKAGSVGIGRIALHLSGPGGFAVEHDWSIAVRPAQPVETQFQAKVLAPGEVMQANLRLLDGLVPGTTGVALSLGSAPRFDVAGLLRALQRYPYMCLEQTVSTAFPLVGVSQELLPPPLVAGAPADPPQARLEHAVSRLLDLQRFDGSFGLWSSRDSAEPWLSAYAMEFLTRARAHGTSVPEAPYSDGLRWLGEQAMRAGSGAPEEFAARAYAHYVLALASAARPGPLRYFADTFTEKLPTPLAKAQIGAALALIGDQARARQAFGAALDNLARQQWGADYGSTVRDAAAMIVLLTESHMMPERLIDLVDRLPATETGARDTSTQVGSSRVDLQACKLEYSIVSPK